MEAPNGTIGPFIACRVLGARNGPGNALAMPATNGLLDCCASICACAGFWPPSLCLLAALGCRPEENMLNFHNGLLVLFEIRPRFSLRAASGADPAMSPTGACSFLPCSGLLCPAESASNTPPKRGEKSEKAALRCPCPSVHDFRFRPGPRAFSLFPERPGDATPASLVRNGLSGRFECDRRGRPSGRSPAADEPPNSGMAKCCVEPKESTNGISEVESSVRGDKLWEKTMNTRGSRIRTARPRPLSRAPG
jgi:hypothetical protein